MIVYSLLSAIPLELLVRSVMDGIFKIMEGVYSFASTFGELMASLDAMHFNAVERRIELRDVSLEPFGNAGLQQMFPEIGARTWTACPEAVRTTLGVIPIGNIEQLPMWVVSLERRSQGGWGFKGGCYRATSTDGLRFKNPHLAGTLSSVLLPGISWKEMKIEGEFGRNASSDEVRGRFYIVHAAASSSQRFSLEEIAAKSR